MKVLIVDDEPPHAFVLELFLKKWGYEVVSLDNGEDALAYLRAEKEPCIAILDWNLPGREGVEVSRELKATRDHRNLYILMLTAKAQAADRNLALQSGVDLFMTKPFDPEELRRNLLEAARILVGRSVPT